MGMQYIKASFLEGVALAVVVDTGKEHKSDDSWKSLKSLEMTWPKMARSLTLLATWASRAL